MDAGLKQQLVQVIARLHRSSWLDFWTTDMDLKALKFMESVMHNSPGADNNVYMVDLQERLHVSKAAISQIANHLENKGYLIREINPQNRRKLTITLTEEGLAALEQAKTEFEEMLELFLDRLGNKDAHETVRLFTRFADVLEEISKERIEN